MPDDSGVGSGVDTGVGVGVGPGADISIETAASTDPNASLTANSTASPAADTIANPSATPSPQAVLGTRRTPLVMVLATWLGNLVISVLTAAFCVLFLYQPVKVEGTSMLPGLEDQERIFVNKFVYHLEPISRGDVIVFRYPRDPSTSYIKRVIGVAGDRIRIVAGLVYVNGEPLAEDYVPQQYVDWQSKPEIVVPPGSFFMMGDHRNMSRDSREFGPVAEKFIVGKAVFGYWPMEKLGKVR